MNPNKTLHVHHHNAKKLEIFERKILQISKKMLVVEKKNAYTLI